MSARASACDHVVEEEITLLIRKHDRASDEEWRIFLVQHDFGQLIAGGRDRHVPVIVPTHFVFDGDKTISLHLARANPVWDALSENASAVVSVVGAYTYIPTDINGGTAEPEGYGVPTSYYAAVQVTGWCETVEGDEIAEILNAQLQHFQPEGGHAVVEPGENPYARQFNAIRGLRLEMTEVRAKFKFGGNKTAEHRLKIAEFLAGRTDPLSAEARSHLLRRARAASGPSTSD